MTRAITVFLRYLTFCVAVSLIYFGGEWALGRFAVVWRKVSAGVLMPTAEWLQEHPPMLVLAICAVLAALATAFHLFRGEE